MSVFTDKEREYLASGVPLGRLATVGPDGMPHVVPTSFRYNPSLTPSTSAVTNSLPARSTVTRSGIPRQRS
jgi:hypothetical protein